MPNVFTHYLCGNTTIESLNTKRKSTIHSVELKDFNYLNHSLNNLEKYRQVFNLGTQGPDILFYYHIWPWKRRDGVNKIGKKMHSKNVNAFFNNALKYITNQKGSVRDLLTAYLCGYACHYSLDSNTHPYIFYKTGFVRQNEKPTYKFSCYHRSFETAIDVLMLDYLMGIKPYEIKVPELIKVTKIESLIIGKMLEQILKDVYDEDVRAKQISTAIIDMVSAQRSLRSRTGLKKILLGQLEKSLGNYQLISSMIHPPNLKENLDYLNLSQNPWALPWDITKKRTDSFIEMFNNSVQESIKFMEAIFQYISNIKDSDYTLKIIGNKSFSSGLDCNKNIKFKYYDNIFDAIKI
ncbi:MAG: zinc dependent phospholipase C family protein [Eubacteriales bacterium]